MNNIIKKISDAKHIEIVVEKEYLYVGSALYTYILTLHKKVSLVCKEKELGYAFSFIPWFEKIKKTDTPSADVSIKLDISSKEFYEYFKKSALPVNKKMALALYSALVYETDGFTNSKLDGTIFAISSELIDAGADYKLAYEHIINYTSLAFLRLKSIMLGKMCLVNDTKVVLFYLRTDDLKASGTTQADAQKVMREAFSLPYVETAILLDSNQENEVIKIINKEI